MSHQDDVFMRVLLVVMGGLVLFAVGIFAIANSVNTKLAPVKGGIDHKAIEARIQPVGRVAVAGVDELPEPAAVKVAAVASPPSAAEIVTQSCASCHASGVGGAPKLGAKEDWTPRFDRGLDALVESVVKGLKVMPPRGGTSYDDETLRGAVQYMLGEAGLGAEAAVAPTKEKAPAEAAVPAAEEKAPAEAPAPAAEEKAPTEAPAAAAPAPDLAKGKEIYGKACNVCHDSGIANAPKLGDKANWEPRIAQGMTVLADHAIKGFQGKVGMMPPKGGHTYLSDEEVTAAVAYMVSGAQ